MGEHPKSNILIIGAGSVGVGASVTYLVRPHCAETLDHPQVLYCYDDNKLKEYKDYTYFTNPLKMVGANYDYTVITVDGASLGNDVGRNLIKTIGEAVRGTNTEVILGSMFLDLRPWVLWLSGLSDEQVVNGYLVIHTYPTKAVTLPVHAPADPESIAKADLAYMDTTGRLYRVSPSMIALQPQ